MPAHLLMGSSDQDWGLMPLKTSTLPTKPPYQAMLLILIGSLVI